MIITYTLVLALTLQPYPTIALMKEFRTRAECEKRIETMIISEEHRARLACVAFAHEGI